VDARLHHLQGKAELVRPADLLTLLQEFHRDKLALFRRHQSGAERMSGYEFNNTYQYVLAREDSHLAWIRTAIDELAGVPDESAASVAVPSSGKGDASGRAIAEADARAAGEFLATWGPRLADLAPGRVRKMLELILGEVAEHQRFFDQVADGDLDLLGKRQGKGTGGGVLGARWVE
jgi:hypothetical protein